MTAIIILNWNGAKETLACLESLEKVQGTFFVVLADNGSTDDSVKRISDYIQESPLDIRFLKLDKNYGFAGGNNRAVTYAAQYSPDSYLLLNNDTEATPEFLVRLNDFRKSDPGYHVLTPRINYFYDKGRIWNCGGVQRLGFRRYLYAGADESKITGKKPFRIGFVTGCALFFTPDVIYDGYTPFTDRFFFGEEDFDFSLRMKKRGIRMACVTDSVIYHKVSVAGDKMIRSGKVYLHLLNRYIDIRTSYSALFLMSWRMAAYFFSVRALKKAFGSRVEAKKKYKMLIQDMRSRDRVDRSVFESLVIKGDYFNE